MTATDIVSESLEASFHRSVWYAFREELINGVTRRAPRNHIAYVEITTPKANASKSAIKELATPTHEGATSKDFLLSWSFTHDE